MFCQGDVYNPPLVGGHWLQGNGVSSGSYPLGDPCGEYPESVVAPFTVSLYVQDYTALCSLAHQQVGDELEGPQCLAPAADEEPRVLALYVELHRIFLRSILRSGGSLSGGFHGTEEVVHDQLGHGNEAGWGCGEGGPYTGGFGSEAQYPSLTLADYVYFYLIAFCAELFQGDLYCFLDCSSRRFRCFHLAQSP